MKKKPTKIPEKIKTLVQELIKQHAWNIGVSHFTGEILYMEENSQEKIDVAADITPDRRYLKFILRIYPLCLQEYAEKGEEALSEIIAHEMAHLATTHLYSLAVTPYKTQDELTEVWESLTQRVGQLSFKLENLKNKKKDA